MGEVLIPRLLISRGAVLDLVDKKGNNIFHISIKTMQHRALQSLLDICPVVGKFCEMKTLLSTPNYEGTVLFQKRIEIQDMAKRFFVRIFKF